MAEPTRETVYVDVDDEITTIIDKVHGVQAKIVALVLPKRATVLQSSVNMKLLKKAADSSRKRVVLISNESGLLPLASLVGMYVASSLQSKPEIPSISADQTDSEIEEIAADPEPLKPKKDFSPKTVADKTVGELADEEPLQPQTAAQKAKPELTPMAIPRPKDSDEETIALDDVGPDNEEIAQDSSVAEAATKPKKKDKKTKVPNFERFRFRLILMIVVIILLVVGFIFANSILPKATIDIATKMTGVSINPTLNLAPGNKKLDLSTLSVPATVQSTQKTDSGQVNTTGQQNNGSAATGTVTMTAQECAPNIGNPNDVPKGSGVVSNGLTYITQSNTSFTYAGVGGGNCVNFQANQSTPIIAQNGGSNYNVSNATFTVSGRSDVTATGSATGGSDNIVQIVTQTDINNATAKLTAPPTGPIKTALSNSLKQAGLYPIPATFNATTPTITQSANVGDQATTVTVTQSITYTMLGVSTNDMDSLITAQIDPKIQPSEQAITSTGLNNASFNIISNSGSTGAQVAMQLTASIGPKLNITSIKQQIAGKKTGDVESLINALPGVTGVTVHYSPFWVTSVPNSVNKITIQVQKSS